MYAMNQCFVALVNRRFCAVLVLLALMVPATALAQPANDDLADAIVIGSLPYSDTGTNVDATSETEPTCDGGGLINGNVWWAFTAPGDMVVQIDTAGSDFDTQLNLLTGPSATFPLTCVAGDDDSGPGTTSQITQQLTNGTNYYISVDGFGGATGNITLNVVEVPSTDLVVTKICTAEVVAGSGAGNYSCTITAENLGTTDATNVVVTDNLVVLAGVSAGMGINASQGSAAIAAGTLTWDAGTLGAGANATLSFNRTVSLQAAEGVAALSNTASISSDLADLDPGNDVSPPATTDIRWPGANFGVEKVYSSGSGGDVPVTLTCSDSVGLIEYAPQSDTTPTSLTVRRFDIDPAGSGTSCSVTEDSLPPGTFVEDYSADCNVDPTSDQGSYACVITNAATRATFAVTKSFNDGNPAEVEVTLSCNTGLPLEQVTTISESHGVNFVIDDFADGELDCEVTETMGVDGYSVSYEAGGLPPSSESCVFEDVGFGAELTCDIVNSLDAVEVSVTKIWIDDNPGFHPVNVAEAEWTCENTAPVVGIDGPSSSGMLDFVGDEAVDSFFVFPRFDGTTVCTVSEVVAFDGGVEINDDECQALAVTPGSGAECTLYNTRLYAGIPTLGQHGLILLSLLMLGIGFVALRRAI